MSNPSHSRSASGGDVVGVEPGSRQRGKLPSAVRYALGLIGLVLMGVGGLFGFRHLQEIHARQGLIAAIQKGDIAQVTHLLDAGVDPNTFTTKSINKPCVSTMLRSTVPQQVRNGLSPRTTALMTAVMSQQGYLVTLLLEKGARVNDVDEYGYTALTLAVSEARIDLVQQLLAYGANPNVPNVARVPLLNWAIMLRQPEIAHALLEKGADPTVPDAKGMLPLYLACVDEEVSVARAILEHGGSAKTTLTGWSVLRLAVSLDNVELTKLLIEKGADPAEVSSTGKSLLDVARSRNRRHVLPVLQEALKHLGDVGGGRGMPAG